MANATKVAVGDIVRYRKANGRWISAYVTAVTSQTAVKLAVRNNTGTKIALNGGADVTKATNNIYQLATTNVWKRY
jgi:hypothetical protein